MNGTDDYSTSQVGPELNGRKRRTLNGTNSVTLNGTNSVTLNGTYVEDLNPYDIELNGIDASEDELDAIRLALAYGDEDVVDAYEGGEMNGLKEILAARKARLANETPEQREARIAKRKALIGGVLSLASSAVPGGATASKLASLIGKGVDKAKTLQTAVEKAAILEDAGILPNAQALTTRAAQETDAGLEPPAETATGMEKLKQWWNGSSTVTKVAVVGGAALAGYLVYRQFFAKKKKRR
jgi:hypothetical protein